MFCWGVGATRLLLKQREWGFCNKKEKGLGRKFYVKVLLVCVGNGNCEREGKRYNKIVDFGSK